MNRRTFNRWGLALVNGTVLSSCASVLRVPKPKHSAQAAKVLSPALCTGDTVGLVAPASGFDSAGYEKAIAHISSWGLRIREGRHLHDKYGYLAGRDKDRVSDLHDMYRDPKVKAIWCIRGGYGVTRILPMLDYPLIASNPKPIIGYSDITALIHAVYLKTGIVGFHGPIAKGPFDDYSREMLRNVLFTSEGNPTISYRSLQYAQGEAYIPEVMAPGDAEGVLSGGNLTLLSALSGTDFHWDAQDKLVFLEDVGEKPYRIDRMLTTLLQSSNLRRARGIVLGIFRGCERKPGEDSLTLRQVLKDRLGALGIPVFYGFTFGHIDSMCTLPVGIHAKWNMQARTLTLLEPASL